MPSLILTRLRQGKRTLPFPETEPVLPERFRGLPTIDQSRCPSDCTNCVDACPTDAITSDGGLRLDLGRCLFCPECSNACPEGAIRFTPQYRLATSNRDDLVLTESETLRLAGRLAEEIHRILGRSLKLRQVSAGGCNGCEADVNVLNTVVFDLGRFGIQFVASPRHADGLLITGAITQNMRLALEKTYSGGARAENCDSGRRLCDLRRSIPRSSRGSQRREQCPSSRPLRSWMPPSSDHHPRWTVALHWKNRRLAEETLRPSMRQSERASRGNGDALTTSLTSA